MSAGFKVALVQGDTRWLDRSANLDYWGVRLAAIVDAVDLVVLPETFLSGFGDAAVSRAEGMDGEGVAFLRAQALAMDCAVGGSLVIAEAGQVWNRFVLALPDGQIHCYDKRHLFRMADEHRRYAGGAQRVTVEWRGVRVNLQICYDLRFPVWCRNRNDYDLQLYVANWPTPRREAWRTLLKARAIENQAFVIGVNRIGRDGQGLEYAGDSLAFGPRGELLSDLADSETTAIVELDLASLRAFREAFPAHIDADRFVIEGEA